MMCGQVSACGGDLTGTWTITSGCLTSAGVKDAESGATGSCSGLTVAVTNISVSGTVTFNADMTYTFASLQEQSTLTLNAPASCVGSGSCSALASALESTGDVASATCSGTSGCSCTAMQTPQTETESGTYSVSGSTVTTVPSTGTASSTPFCVQGSVLHLLDTSTMSMGAMGQATIDEDTIGIKQ